MNKDQYTLKRKVQKLDRLLSEALSTAAQIDAYGHAYEVVSLTTGAECHNIREAISAIFSMVLTLKRRIQADWDADESNRSQSA